MATVFIDLKARNEAARSSIANRLFILNGRAAEEKKALPPEVKKEIAILTRLSGGKSARVVDPLFYGLRQALGTTNPDILKITEHTDGSFGTLGRDERLFTAVYGLLSLDNQAPIDFEWKVVNGRLTPTTSDARFFRAVSIAVGEYSSNVDLFENTFDTIKRAGGDSISATRWASVVRKLRSRGVAADNSNLDLITEKVLGEEVGSADGAAPSSVDISFPDLEEPQSLQIIANNIMAMHIFYPSWMLEEARFYDVYDKIEELFLNQMLPISRGTAGDKIYARWKKSTQRISKPERLNFYASCFGGSGGSPSLANQNTQFSDLWLRFVSGVSEWARKLQVDDLLRTRIPLSVSTEQVRKSARDLAANLSLHGYGVAYFAATELQNEINEIKDILSDEEVRMAYGARDMRQLIEQVSIYELGGARDVTRYFTMATSGAIITRWLAQKAADLSGSYFRPILDIDVVRKPSIRSSSVSATRNPTDRDLVDACEQWLAVTGTTDDRVSEFAQPSEAPAMTSRPVPQFAKEYLEGLMPAGLAVANGGGNGYQRRR
jgi:hypothetical protein